MTRNETRLKNLEKAVSPNKNTYMVIFADWEKGEEPPPEKIQVTYFDGETTRQMTLAEYRELNPDWEDDTHIVVGYEDEPYPEEEPD